MSQWALMRWPEREVRGRGETEKRLRKEGTVDRMAWEQRRPRTVRLRGPENRASEKLTRTERILCGREERISSALECGSIKVQITREVWAKFKNKKQKPIILINLFLWQFASHGDHSTWPVLDRVQRTTFGGRCSMDSVQWTHLPKVAKIYWTMPRSKYLFGRNGFWVKTLHKPPACR